MSLQPTTYNLQPRSGFTLLELIIYLAVISGAILSFVYFMIAVSNSRSKTYVAQEVHANARSALNLISQRIRASNGVNIGASTFNTHPGVLSLDFGAVNATKNPTLINVHPINGTLQIQEGASAVVAVTSDKVRVSNLIFTNVTAPNTRENIRIDLTVKHTTTDEPTFSYTKSFTTTVSVRQ